MRLLRLLLLPCLGLALLVSGGCMSRSKKKDYPATVARFLIEAGARDASVLMQLPKSGVTIAVEPKSYFTEFDIIGCDVVSNELGKSLVFQFTPEASRDLYKLSVPNQGKRIVTMLNGRAIGARRIDAAMGQGYLVTYVELPDEELEEVAKNIARTSADMREDLEKKQK